MVKLKREMTTVDWGLMNDSQEIYSGINGFETSLNEWYTLNAKLKCGFNENYCEKFEKNFHEVLEDVSNKIDKGKLKLKEMLLLHEETSRKTEEERAQADQEKKKDKQKRFEFEQEQINAEREICTKSSYEEILLLSESLIKNCEIDLEKVGDHQLLDLKKNVFHFTSELREIM